MTEKTQDMGPTVHCLYPRRLERTNDLPGLMISSPSLNATDTDDFLFRLMEDMLAKFALPSSIPSEEILLLWAVLNSVRSFFTNKEQRIQNNYN